MMSQRASPSTAATRLRFHLTLAAQFQHLEKNVRRSVNWPISILRKERGGATSWCPPWHVHKHTERDFIYNFFFYFCILQMKEEEAELQPVSRRNRKWLLEEIRPGWRPNWTEVSTMPLPRPDQQLKRRSRVECHQAQSFPQNEAAGICAASFASPAFFSPFLSRLNLPRGCELFIRAENGINKEKWKLFFCVSRHFP